MSDQVEVQYDNSGKTTIQISGSPVHRRRRHFEPSSDAHDVRARQSRQVRHMSNTLMLSGKANTTQERHYVRKRIQLRPKVPWVLVLACALTCYRDVIDRILLPESSSAIEESLMQIKRNALRQRLHVRFIDGALIAT